MTVYGVTASTGGLGQLVVKDLAKKVSPSNIVAFARNTSKAEELFKGLGVKIVELEYDSTPEVQAKALKGVDRLLLISSSEIGKRATQHKNVIEGAKLADVSLVVYTSLLKVDKKLLEAVGKEHLETEEILKASGVPHVILRNGWYIENYVGNAGPAIEHGALLGSGGEVGKISGASRPDFAEAAVAVLVDESLKGPIYELAGDHYFTEVDLAETFAEISGKPVAYKELPEEGYAQALTAAGIPAIYVELLAKSSSSTRNGSLFDDSKTLSKIIGHPTANYKETLKAALSS